MFSGIEESDECLVGVPLPCQVTDKLFYSQEACSFILPQDYNYVISLLVIVVVSLCRNTTIRLWQLLFRCHSRHHLLTRISYSYLVREHFMQPCLGTIGVIGLERTTSDNYEKA